jgi:heme/copper-type cytochrome/quinol oxidase subunit 3
LLKLITFILATDPIFGVSFASFRNSERHVGQPEDTNSNKEGLVKVSVSFNDTLALLESGVTSKAFVANGSIFGDSKLLEQAV